MTEKTDGNDRESSIWELFCNKKIRMAAWMGVSLDIIQQVTGIDAIMFYSTEIFSQTHSSLSFNTQTCMVMGLNFITVVPATFMLAYFGRKTLLTVFTGGCALTMFGMGFAASRQWAYVELVMTLLYVCAFEFGPGPVVWTYNSEVLDEKAMSVANGFAWFFVLIVGLFTPTLM